MLKASSSSANWSVMEPDPLQCPRCNSSNTKFCYYNNYSLSQPRHFCKACKRYWTRGGTLRNVPVGGGYRKNKKFKCHPPPTAAVGGGDRLPTAAAPMPNTSNLFNNPFVHNLPTNFSLELNFPISETRVSSDSPRFEHLLRKNHSGVEFSSYFRNEYEQNTEDRADFISFGSSSFAQHQRSNEFPNLMRYEDMEMVVGNEQIGKESNIIHSNQMEQINNSSPFSWNSNNVGVWFDPSSSSLPSMI